MPFVNIQWTASTLQARDTVTLTKEGKPIWTGPIGSPIEDVDFDGFIVHPTNFSEMTAWIMKHNPG